MSRLELTRSRRLRRLTLIALGILLYLTLIVVLFSGPAEAQAQDEGLAICVPVVVAPPGSKIGVRNDTVLVVLRDPVKPGWYCEDGDLIVGEPK